MENSRFKIQDPSLQKSGKEQHLGAARNKFATEIPD
jgi:hypothetical protein